MKSFSRPDFVISIEGFSGPFDLLCALVESRKFEASRVKITQIIKIYGAYLAKTRQASADILAEFFYMAAGLLLEKTRSLLPKSDLNNNKDLNDDLGDLDLNNLNLDEINNIDVNDNDIMERIARYRPYRAAFLWLAERLESEAKSFRRQANHDENKNKIKNSGLVKVETLDGDIYEFSKIWWEVFNKYNENKKRDEELRELEDCADWDGFNKNAPDEEQIQNRIDELDEQLKTHGDLFLNSLCNNVKTLVVTLLALLEMCRMGKIAIEQDELFGDVKIFSNLNNDLNKEKNAAA